MKKIIVALFVFNTVVGYAQVKLNDYELSIDRNEPLKLLIKAKIHVEDSLSIYPYCPSNKYENGWASFIEIESVYHNGRKIAIGELINASWPILNKNTENKLLDVNYSVDISFIKDQWITGNEQSGININDSYYLVSQALFLFGKKDIESKIKFSIPNDWLISTPWKKESNNTFRAKNYDDLIRNIIAFGKYKSSNLNHDYLNLEIIGLGSTDEELQIVTQLLNNTIPILSKIFPYQESTNYLIVFIKTNRDDGESYHRSNAFTVSNIISEENKIIWGNQMLNELIHLWNGKLMTSENYQNSQWFSEGFTEYLSNLILLESDEITLDQYIDKAEKIIGAYTYFSQRQYPEVSLVNAGINKGKYRFGVYNGGWVAALCFDLFLRNSPGNEKISIFDFFTTFFKKHKNAPYTLNDIMATLENLLNEPKDVFFKNYIYGSELLPFQNLLTDSGWKIAYIPFRSEAYLTKISFNSNWPIINQNNNVVWSYYFNDQYNRLKNLYKSNSISFDQNGFVKDGYSKLITALKNQHVKIDSLITTASILAQPKKQIFYEISTFWASNGKVYKQLVILTKTEGKIQRELEFIAESKLANIDIVEIDVQRAKWISLCNEHNSNELVDKMYTSNALYYNHKPMIIGKKGISKDYSYMNAQNYHLFLEPLVIEPVNEDLVYEIGQCKGSYNGKYILIWKREKNGYWKIFFDSNI